MGRVKVLSVVRLGFAAWFLLLPAAGCRDHDGKKKAPAPEAAARRDAALAAARVWFPPAVPPGYFRTAS